MAESIPKNQPCFVVEGNIGAGKSTFLKIIGNYLQAQLVFEPHEQWQNIGGENLLDYFYKDTQRWSYTFQSYAFITRILAQQEHARRNKQPIQVLERSIYSDRFCFAKNCFEMGLMTSLEWKLYQEWFGWLVESHTTQPSAFIYLRTDVEICYERLVKRNRSEETGVSRDYLELLHRKHEDWLIHNKEVASSVHSVPVLVLECNEDFENNQTVQKEHMRTIVNFLETKFNVPAHVSRAPHVTL